MSWPTDDLVKTELDAGTDNPANARAQILAIANKVSALISALQTNFPNIGGAVTSDHGELNKLDGLTASVAELNKLAGLGATTAELNEVDASAAAVANFASALRFYTYNGNAALVAKDASSTGFKDVYVSVGPTGSGAGSIWTAMDVLPAAAKAVRLRAVGDFTASSTSFDSIFSVLARPTGSTLSDLASARVIQESFPAGAIQTKAFQQEFVVPLGTSRRFDLQWRATFLSSSPGPTLNLYMTGFYV